MATRRSSNGTPEKNPKKRKQHRKASTLKKGGRAYIREQKLSRRRLLRSPNTTTEKLKGGRSKTVHTIVLPRDDAMRAAKDFLQKYEPEGATYISIGSTKPNLENKNSHWFSTLLRDSWLDTYQDIDARALTYARQIDIEYEQFVTLEVVIIKQRRV